MPTARLALVTAPAGYGKTTLLGQWARASRLRVAWLSLDADDNDPECFLRYLVTAWNEVHPGITETPVGLLLGSMAPDIDAVLAAFINVGSELSENIVLVLDDYHLIDSPSISLALTFLIDHLAPRMHFVLAGRGEPSLPLARYRARGEMLEFGSEDLRFQEAETRAFVSYVLPGGLSDDAPALLQASLEGWVGGLQLACHALRHHPQSVDPISISGKHRFIADYLREEVLADLEESTRRFLLQTSILEQLHGPLCDAVVEWSDSQHLLEHLEREGLFLTAMDDVREWFRFHPLLRGVLREELDRRHPSDVASLHGRASRWYLEQAMPEQAFHHAVAGNDPALVTQIGEDYCVIKLESGELNVVGRWMQLIPEAWFTTYPLISLLKVAYLIYTGAFEDSAALLNAVEDRIGRSTNWDRREQLAKVATVRCAIACFQNDLSLAEVHASEALGELPEEDGFYRASVYHALGETYARNAYWAQAKESLLAALNIVHAPSSRIRSVHIYGALADLELRQGHLETAAEYWSNALGAIREREMWGRLPIPVTGWVWIRLGELFYERNRLAEAWDHISKGLELALAGGDVRSLIAGYLLSARLNLTEGEIEQAAQCLDQARPLLEQSPLPEWVSRYERYLLELWLAQDRLRAVVRWIEATAATAPDQQRGHPELDHLTLARALIVSGDQPSRGQAADILRRLIDATAAEGQKGIQLEALALQALGRWAGGDRAGALTSLHRALRLAEPEGYVRVFADLGLPMVELLHEARARDVMPDYVQTIIDACAPDLAMQSSVSAPSPDPLSEREQEVLGLIAAGLTNREIAEHLFISAETVKKHAASIYAKLDVGRRTEAVARAGELGLLNHRY
jgi:LuxR family maltose regulon positive regulatory protein